ncbi:MAG: hypothetical protein WD119_02285, partial [Pirellulaceae bacterium]
MRLTLRTLLAHLDKTLSEADAAAIGEKIKESSFASQVVERIRAVLTNGRLAAPSPGANGPTDDPNVVGEYLDSTLSAEQAAEVDRNCLESDVHLAEAAACHQVLTMVLGTPAEVPQDLRKRIYALGRRADDQATEGSGPEDSTIDRPVVAPVGLDDSGAFRAASRLEERGDSESLEKAGKRRGKGAKEPAMAGSRPLSASEANEIFGDRIRTTRVVPWLVTLGIAALFLFVLAQAFRPFMGSDEIAVETEKPDQGITPLPSDGDGEQAVDGREGDEAESKPTTGVPAAAEGDADEAGSSSTADPGTDRSQPDSVVALPADDDDQPPPPPSPDDDTEDEREAPMESEGDAAGEPDARVARAELDREGETIGDEQPETETVDGIAQVASDQGLLLVAGEQQGEWEDLGDEAIVPSGRTIVCPPLYRIRLTIDERADLSLVGPARLRIGGTVDQPQIVLERGRLLVASLTEDLLIDLQLDDLSGELSLTELGDVAAIEVSHFRPPGSDPTNPENSIRIAKLESVAGRLGWSPDGGDSSPIETGERWTRIGNGDAQVLIPGEPADWIDAPEGNRQSLDNAARQGLLTFLDPSKPVALSLREAVGFRRAEVGALAAQTLLLMGEPDVYFGSDGVLSTASQKSYWADHVQALQAKLNEGPEAAAAVKQAAVEMEGASAETLFRLLWGYSPEQLKAGADAFLVETLDSPQMSLRVLAIENLRQITGTSLFFKPEQETSNRRRNDIKKWETRLRRDDIVWESIPIPR